MNWKVDSCKYPGQCSESRKKIKYIQEHKINIVAGALEEKEKETKAKTIFEYILSENVQNDEKYEAIYSKITMILKNKKTKE